MSDATTEVKDDATGNTLTPDVGATASSSEETTSFADRYSDVLGKVNQTLDQVDWNQMGRIGKIVGIFAAVIVALHRIAAATKSPRWPFDIAAVFVSAIMVFRHCARAACAVRASR